MGWLRKIPGFGWTSIFDKDYWNGVSEGFDQLGDWLGDKWHDLTGQTAIEQQNEANKQMAKYQADINEQFYNKYQSPEAIKRQYMEAGLNPNLAYGSVSAGISSAPRMSLPQVERNMSGAEKINKALSSISAALGLAQGIYQTSVAREAAQQAAIKTLDDAVTYQNNALNYTSMSDLLGASIGIPTKLIFRKKDNRINFVSAGDVWKKYHQIARESFFNEKARSLLQNYADFGAGYDTYGKVMTSDYFGVPNLKTRNDMNNLKFRLMKDIGNTGTYGKLLISALDLFM